MNIQNICKNAKSVASRLANLNSSTRSEILKKISAELSKFSKDILESNRTDCEAVKKLLAEGKISQSLMSRLEMNEGKSEQLEKFPLSVDSQPDPVGRTLSKIEMSPGLTVEKVSVPLGVIAVIFESRPEVVVQLASLGIKAGCPLILKGGSEALHTNRILTALVQNVLAAYDLKDAVQLIESRDDVKEILNMEEYINLIIPRGSADLVNHIKKNTDIPVLGHSEGICHIYIDSEADKAMAEKVVIDAKIDYPSACNAMETLLIHHDFLPESSALLKKLNSLGVTLVADSSVGAVLDEQNIFYEKADDKTWKIEYGDLKLSLKSVISIDEAIQHILVYGSGHTDSIITDNPETAEIFLNNVDSASVMVNASTRFADGFNFGLGAEVGVSTSKIHARGPVGVEGLLTTKFIVRGCGDIKSDYTKGLKTFSHRKLTDA